MCTYNLTKDVTETRVPGIRDNSRHLYSWIKVRPLIKLLNILRQQNSRLATIASSFNVITHVRIERWSLQLKGYIIVKHKDNEEGRKGKKPYTCKTVRPKIRIIRRKAFSPSSMEEFTSVGLRNSLRWIF